MYSRRHRNITHQWGGQSLTLQAWSQLPEAWRQLAKAAQWCLETDTKRDTVRENMSIYIMMQSGSLVYEIILVITYVCNQLCSRDYNHLSDCALYDMFKVGYSFKTADCSQTGSYSSMLCTDRMHSVFFLSVFKCMNSLQHSLWTNMLVMHVASWSFDVLCRVFAFLLGWTLSFI